MGAKRLHRGGGAGVHGRILRPAAFRRAGAGPVLRSGIRELPPAQAGVRASGAGSQRGEPVHRQREKSGRPLLPGEHAGELPPGGRRGRHHLYRRTGPRGDGGPAPGLPAHGGGPEARRISPGLRPLRHGADGGAQRRRDRRRAL